MVQGGEEAGGNGGGGQRFVWGLKDGGAGRRWDGESRIGEGSGALGAGGKEEELRARGKSPAPPFQWGAGR